MYAIAAANQKGGVGKTTVVFAVGAGLAMKGFKTLFVDLDAQGNLTQTLGASRSEAGAFEVMAGEAGAREAAQAVGQWRVIASTPRLVGADAAFAKTGKEFLLKEALAPLQGEYDFCVIDTPPALGILTVNALAACSGAIVPAQADAYSLNGIGDLEMTVAAVRKYCNPPLEIMGVVLTRFNGRAVISKDMAAEAETLAKRLGSRLYESKIREAVAIKESQAMGQSIYEYAPKSKAAADCLSLVGEILESGGNFRGWQKKL